MPASAREPRADRAPRRRPHAPAWARFATDLATVLASLEPTQFLVVASKRGNRYVQFARTTEDGVANLAVEAVSNAYLSADEQLTEAQIVALGKLGWQPPAPPDDEGRVANGSPNFHAEYRAPLELDRIARVAVATLTKVHRVRRPADLEYTAFHEPGSKEILLPALGIDRRKPLPPAPITAAPPEQSFEDARAAVLAAVREGAREPTLDFDEDGDIPVRYGDVVLFVRVSDSPRFVRVFSPLLSKVEIDDRVLQRVNDMNCRATLVRFLATGGTIWASTDVFAYPLLPKHVVHACHAVGGVANEMRPRLEAEFGAPLQAPAARGLPN